MGSKRQCMAGSDQTCGRVSVWIYAIESPVPLCESKGGFRAVDEITGLVSSIGNQRAISICAPPEGVDDHENHLVERRGWSRAILRLIERSSAGKKWFVWEETGSEDENRDRNQDVRDQEEDERAPR